jgi:hypothetical protein
LSTNRRIEKLIFAAQRSPDFSGLSAALEPQSCDDLAYTYALNRRTARGLPAFHEIGDRRSMMNPSPVPDSRATSRDPDSIFVRDCRLIVGF